VELALSISRPGHALTVLPLTERGRSQGLNRAIKAAKNDLILRLDARASIATDYISSCVATLVRTGADNVGGLQRPIAKTMRQQAFAIALWNPFGVGDAKFRLGRSSGWVESVYLGCFRREVFDRVGYFDETAPIIGEDTDLNLRLGKAGGKIYMNNEILVHYAVRETFTAFWRLYYRYGGARVGVLLKHRSLTSWRQQVPPLLLASLLVLGGGSLLVPWLLYPFLAILGSYLMANTLVSITASLKRGKVHLAPLVFVAFICMHFGYAFGYCRRLLFHPKPGSYWAH
jgi:GT2 family glycosyltransferase